MTKQELLNKLDTNPLIVEKGSLVLRDTINGVKKYTIEVQMADINGKRTLRSKTYIVYINDEGGVNESAYLDKELTEAIPKDLISYLNANFVTYEIMDMLIENKYYSIKGIIKENDGTFSNKMYIICKESDNSISHGELKDYGNGVV
jgi:hypothetical protein